MTLINVVVEAVNATDAIALLRAEVERIDGVLDLVTPQSFQWRTESEPGPSVVTVTLNS